MTKILVLILLVFCSSKSWSQDSGAKAVTDTTIRTQVVKKHPVAKPKQAMQNSIVAKDSVPVPDSALRKDSAVVFTKEYRPNIIFFKRLADTPVFAVNPFFRFTDPMRYSVTIKKWQGKEALFYSIIGLLIFFALIRNGFRRYVGDLFKTYFQTTVKQKQTKELLLQNPLASALTNLFFVLSIGMFVTLLLQYFKLGLDYNFWLLYLYCVLGLIAIYAAKFVSLKFFGWIFQVADSTDAYIFIVFTTNKIIGIILLPFLVLLAFTYGVINEAAMSLSIMLVVGLIVYRFFLSYVSIRRQIRISFFHFLLYLLAFEVIPLLLINKLLFSFLGETY